MELTLSNGAHMPILGLGTYLPIQGEKNLIKSAVINALDVGYRHIDTAQLYNTEKEIGEGLHDWLERTGTPREEVYLTTKLWNTFHEVERIEPACRRSLAKLNVAYIDLFLIHWPTAFVYSSDDCSLNDPINHLDYPLETTWKGMENLVRKGLVKSIGLSNFNKRQIERILKVAKIRPVVNQIESSVAFPNQELIDYCHSVNIKVIAYLPLGNPSQFKDCQSLIENPRIIEMAKRYKKTPAQICLKFCVQRGLCVIPKSVNAGRIKENFKIFDFTLNGKDFESLSRDIAKRNRYLE